MKRGKREKVKHPALQSYILSMLSLVLCCTMFMSATMAWFTSEVTTTGNQIYVGTLDVDLRDADGGTLHGKSGVLFDQVLLSTVDENGDPKTLQVTHWEDGAIALEPLQVVNEGDLAFRYELNLILSEESTVATASGETQKNDLTAITDQFEVWVLNGSLLSSDEYVDVEADDSGWAKVVVTTTDTEGNKSTADTLTAILESGTPVFSGTMTAEDVAGKAEETHQYTVALRMKPGTSATYIEVDENGNTTTVSIMGKTLILNAKLVASQLVDGQTSEDDDKTPVDPSTEGSSDETSERPSSEEQSTDGE